MHHIRIYNIVSIIIYIYVNILHPYYWLIMIDPHSWFMMVLLLLSPNPSSRPKARYIKFRTLRICFWITPLIGVFMALPWLSLMRNLRNTTKVSCLNQRRPHVVLLLLLSHFWHGSGRSVSAVRSDGKSFHPANGGPKIHKSEHQPELDGSEIENLTSDPQSTQKSASYPLSNHFTVTYPPCLEMFGATTSAVVFARTDHGIHWTCG